ncbi:Response regulator protein VraR [Paenibacillus allorhizoplanae]|uniref:Response regulator protein VraR n=1 Tax=Paenibacillus allorhizoplanae TaxID=2905648 RepID=A0ABN8GDA5_9BACL|nr:response regulator transcription factor [Paenibacillus allorhizoplanae]CAH1206050.1 Response regulator protein VraR [Paenibacillus allorhizoplanae]
MYKVVIADDRQLIRAGLHMLLDSCGLYIVAGEASDGNEAVSQSLALVPDLLLTDLKMPGQCIIEGVRILKERLPNIKIIILTAFDESEDIYRACKAGVDGYLMKDTSPETILSTIQEVMKGTSMFQPKENKLYWTRENLL